LYKKVIRSMQFSLNSSSSDLHSILYFNNQQFFPHIPQRCDSVGKKIYVVEHSDHWDRVNKAVRIWIQKRKKIIFCSTRVNTSVIEHVYCLCGGCCVTRDRKKIYFFKYEKSFPVQFSNKWKSWTKNRKYWKRWINV